MAVHGVIVERAMNWGRPVGPFQLNEDSPQAQGLLAWWPLNPTHRWADNFIRQLPSNAQGGVLNGGRGNGLIVAPNFDGTDDQLLVPSVANTVANPVSVCAWVWPDNIANATSRHMVNLETALGIISVCLQQVAGDASGVFRFRRVCNVGTSAKARISTAVLTTTSWQHLIGVDTDTTVIGTGINCYYNNVLANGATTDGAVALDNTNGNWFVGGKTSGAANFDGGIADARVYSGALSANQRALIYGPATRWDLYWVPGRRVFFDVGAASSVLLRRLQAEGLFVGSGGMAA